MVVIYNLLFFGSLIFYLEIHFKNFFMFAKTYRNNTIAVTQQLLQALEVPFSNNKIKEAVLQNPDYLSIAAVHDVLNEYKVENLVVQVEAEKLNEIPVPFIAHTRSNHGFVTVTEVEDGAVSYLKPGSYTLQQRKPVNEFLKEWSGVVLVAEKSEQSGEKDFVKNKKLQFAESIRTLLLFTGLCVLIVALVSLGFRIEAVYFILLMLKTAGVVVTAMLLWYEIDKNNPFLQKVCSGGKATNCNAILQSKQAKLLGIISWSEIGFFYFAGGLFAVIIGYEGSAGLLAWFNLFALPYTIFSVYYQWSVAKQWCPLCLTVQALLLSEAVIFFTFHLHQSFFNGITNYTILIFAFLLPVLSWYFLKPLLLKAKEGVEYKNRFFRMKKDPRIFEALLAKQKHITASADGLGITLGNLNATNTIIKVCNPYCGPCAKAHPEIHELIHTNKNLKVQILFTATAEETDKRSKPVKHLLAVAEKQNKQLTEKALDDWYLSAGKDYDAFAAKYPMNGELKQQDAKIIAMNNWCDEVKIEFTPTFFVNGYQLPENYTINELKYFLSS